MENLIDQFNYLRALRLSGGNIVYGSSANNQADYNSSDAIGCVVFVFVGILSIIGCLIYGLGFFESLKKAIEWSVIATVVYLLFPVIYFFIWLIRLVKNPNAIFLDKLSRVQKWFTCLAMSFAITTGIDIITLTIFKWWKTKHHGFHYTTHKIIIGKSLIGGFSILQFLAVWSLVLIFLVLFFMYVFDKQATASKTKNSKKQQKMIDIYESDSAQPFRLWIGESTGWLSSLSHGAGISANQQITLRLEDATQNILILGAIGSGKTTHAMYPLLIQLMDQDCGGLIFDIKGDFQNAALLIAETFKREIIVIGVNRYSINLLADLTPEMASSFLKSIFTLNCNNRNSAFWLNTATELCRNILGILSFIPEYYSLNGLYCYLFDLDFRTTIDDKLKKLQKSLNAKENRLLTSYWRYHKKIFNTFEDKVKTGVNATIAKVLAPFNHPDLADAFCTEHRDNVVIEDLLNGAIYLVEMPLSTWGLSGKVVCTLIKLRFFNLMQQRVTRSQWNQDRPVFFMCDEFQEIVSANQDGISDINFWDKARSSKTIGIISAQAVSSFYATIGDRDLANALLQNFRQKICFKTEDVATLNYFRILADKVTVERKSYSSNSGVSKKKELFGSSSKYSSCTEHTSYVDKTVLDAQLFRNLGSYQSLALLSINGKSMDDVINTLGFVFD